MSYSRWSYSCWYTFADVNRKDDEPTLNVNCEHQFSFSECKESKTEILNYYRNLRFDRNPLNYQIDDQTPPKDHYRENEIMELSEIIDRFIKDYEVMDEKG